MRKYYNLHTSGRVADIQVYGDITSSKWADSDVTSYDLVNELAGLDVDEVNVYINSYGGEVAEGLAIYHALKRHPARVSTYCDGFACSIASVIFMAGDVRAMGDASLLMIHNASTVAAGTSAELSKAAEDLETISNQVRQAYLNAGVALSEDELQAMLDAETWLTPVQALELGFATAIAKEPQSQRPTQSARRSIFDRMISIPERAEKPKTEDIHTEEPKENRLLNFLAGAMKAQ